MLAGVICFAYFVYYLISNLSGYLLPIYAEQALRIPLATTGWLNTFAALVSLLHAVGQRPAETGQWMASVQAALAARGFDAAQAHQGALVQLSGLIEQQARLIACEDIYRLIAVLALGAAAYMLLQRRLA